MSGLLNKISTKHKNNKLLYYTLGFARQLIPDVIYQKKLDTVLENIRLYDTAYIEKRVNDYNKLKQQHELQGGVKLSDFTLKRKHKVYFFDTQEYTRYFNPEFKIAPLFGDITYVPDEPSIVKSRPIDNDNANSVLLNLNKVRHFTFVNDAVPFIRKRNMLVWRGVVRLPHRIKFMQMYFNTPLCNLGKINKDGQNKEWLTGKLSIDQHLSYKFILCIEGNDVASNLKWVMSSNSIAVMPKPKYETWFMEGKLIAGYHYIEINDDYSDLEERLTYYIEHTDKVLAIIKNANEYVEQFRDKKREDLISLLVLKKYFEKTGQVPTVK